MIPGIYSVWWLLPAVRGARVQGILLAGLAGFVAMALFVIVSLDRPFQGAMAIPSDSYQLVRDQLMK